MESYEFIFNDTNDSSTFDGNVDPVTPYHLLGFACRVAMIIMGVVGVIGNAISIRYFSRKSGARSTVSVLLTALSTFDLILLLTGTPIYSIFGIYSIDRHPLTLWILAYVMTIVLYPFSNMAQMGSVLIMMVISVERWLGVCHPFLARRKLTVRRVRVCIVVVAVISILYNLCRFWEHSVNSDGVLDPLLRNDPVYKLIYFHWMYFTFVFLLPFLVIVVFNCLVAIGIRKAICNRPRCQLNVQQRRERRTTLMLLVVVGIFLLCNSLSWPLNAYETLGYYQGDSEETLDFLTDLSNLLVLSHPSLNIFVYLYFSSAFRRKCFSWRSTDANANHDASRQVGFSVASDYYAIQPIRKSTASYFLAASSQRRSSSVSLMDVELKISTRGNGVCTRLISSGPATPSEDKQKAGNGV